MTRNSRHAKLEGLLRALASKPFPSRLLRNLDLRGVGVGANLLATEACNHVDKSPVVLNALLCASPGLLLLLLLGDLRGLTLHLASTRERTVHLA